MWVLCLQERTCLHLCRVGVRQGTPKCIPEEAGVRLEEPLLLAPELGGRGDGGPQLTAPSLPLQGSALQLAPSATPQTLNPLPAPPATPAPGSPSLCNKASCPGPPHLLGTVALPCLVLGVSWEPILCGGGGLSLVLGTCQLQGDTRSCARVRSPG